MKNEIPEILAYLRLNSNTDFHRNYANYLVRKLNIKTISRLIHVLNNLEDSINLEREASIIYSLGWNLNNLYEDSMIATCDIDDIEYQITKETESIAIQGAYEIVTKIEKFKGV